MKRNWKTAVSTMLISAAVVGGAGFLLGFFGPMIIAPGANQGPLLGIFITGPLGFVLGIPLGFIYWLMKTRKQ
jgi:hypothetical protein